jgi:hypothetical protein
MPRKTHVKGVAKYIMTQPQARIELSNEVPDVTQPSKRRRGTSAKPGANSQSRNPSECTQNTKEPQGGKRSTGTKFMDAACCALHGLISLLTSQLQKPGVVAIREQDKKITAIAQASGIKRVQGQLMLPAPTLRTP